MFQDPTPHLDIAYKLIHIVGIPALVAALIWVVRTFDASQRQLKDIDVNSKAAFNTATTIQGQVAILKDNHMAHMGLELQDQTKLLINMDKNIGLLVDRTPRSVEITTHIKNLEA